MWTEHYNFYTQGFIAFLPPLAGLLLTLFCAYGLRVAWKEKKNGRDKGRYTLPFLLICTAFGLLWTIGIGRELGSTYLEYRFIMNQHHYQEVEGMIADYNTYAAGRQGEESFTVGEVEFHYYPYSLFGFRKTQRRGGPLADGMYVRIQYHEGTILRLWVRT